MFYANFDNGIAYVGFRGGDKFEIDYSELESLIYNIKGIELSSRRDFDYYTGILDLLAGVRRDFIRYKESHAQIPFC